MTRQERSYNHIYWLGRVCVQILQQSQREGLLVRLFPSVTLTVRRQYCVVGVSLEWLAGDINIVWATKSFQESDRVRRAKVEELARKAGITRRQEELRWGW